MQPVSPRRILVFCLPGIGDAILFTPALSLLRQLFPQAHIAVMTMFHGTADILATNPDLDEVHHFDFFNAPKLESIRRLWQLRRDGYDLSIMAFPSNRLEYNWVNWFVGRRWAAAHRYTHQSWRNCWFVNNITVREDGHLHNVEENLRLIRAIADRVGVTVPDLPAERPALMQQSPLKLLLSDEARQYADSFFAKHGLDANSLLFGFHTWSSTFKNMTCKCWDKDNFVALIRRLSATHPDAHFLVFSGPADTASSEYIAKHGGDRVLLVQERNLGHAVALQARCRVFITNDSGIMHLAAAVGVPVVALFGPTDWRRLHPWTPQHVVVRQNLPCMPCFYYSSRPLRCVAGVNYACMREISVETVYAAVENTLTNS
jgi:heptosyltransferase-2